MSATSVTFCRSLQSYIQRSSLGVLIKCRARSHSSNTFSLVDIIVSDLGIEERASELVISILAGDVGINVVETRSQMADVLRRLASDRGKHADTGDLEKRGGGLNKLTDIGEHLESKKAR